MTKQANGQPDEFKSFLKIPGGGEINRCYYSFKLDTYGRGCQHDCPYCYAKSSLDFRGLWDERTPAAADFGKIQKLFEDIFDSGKSRSKYREILENRVPLRLGSMTDCFGPIEKKQKVSLRLLQLCKEYNYPYVIFTKNKLVAQGEWLEALDPELAYVQFSITTPYDDVAREHEPVASSTSDRLSALKILADRGFHTATRINPLFPIYPDGYFSGERKFEEEPKALRYFDWSLVDMVAETGCKMIIAGFIRLSNWNIRWIKERTGEDYTYLFDPKTKHKNTALHFSTEEKRYYYERIRDMCHKHGMEFSVCYDGDEAYETFRYLWADPNDCCNGKSHVKRFGKAMDFENDEFIASPRMEKEPAESPPARDNHCAK